jgi:hypothetical protein
LQGVSLLIGFRRLLPCGWIGALFSSRRENLMRPFALLDQQASTEERILAAVSGLDPRQIGNRVVFQCPSCGARGRTAYAYLNNTSGHWRCNRANECNANGYFLARGRTLRRSPSSGLRWRRRLTREHLRGSEKPLSLSFAELDRLFESALSCFRAWARKKRDAPELPFSWRGMEFRRLSQTLLKKEHNSALFLKRTPTFVRF